MRKPDGTIDLIGAGMQIGLGVIDLVKEFSPSPNQREQNRKDRKIRVAVRRLRHRFKATPVDLYVKVNFGEYSVEEQQTITAYIKSQLNQL